MNKELVNPHLDGDAFFWKAGSTGVFLSHGFTATTAEIRYLAKAFHQEGYTVAAPLLPGHGTRPEALNRVTWQEWVRSGQETLERLFETCEKVFIGGQSLGGVLALYLASQQPLAAGLLLYAPAIATPMTWSNRLRLHIGAHFLTQLPRESLDCSTEWQGYPGLPLKCILQLLKFQKAAIQRLSDIHQPILIFQGRMDKTVAGQAGEIILRGCSSTVKEHHWMEKSSHAIPLDVERDQVADLSLQFMRKYR